MDHPIDLEPIKRLSKDIAKAAVTLTDDEARYLVDSYYQHQENRLRTAGQLRSQTEEPHATLAWLNTQDEVLENQLKRVLDVYSMVSPVGRWMRSQYGIGPVIAAGFLAHIDIEKAPTAGHIWRFAGLDPSVKWNKGEKRPWNASLKTLCWKLGQSFMMFAGADECRYGKIYRARKEFEIKRNDSGANAEAARESLERRKFGKTTEAFKHLSAGKFPPAQIDARARRYAVKMFLAHLQEVWWFCHTGKRAPDPYVVEYLRHVHIVRPEGELPTGF